MTGRLALTPAIGLFTGLSMVSFGAVSMWLTGVHGAPAANPCTSKTATQPGKSAGAGAGGTAPLAARSGANARHPAHLPVMLDAAAQHLSGPVATRNSSSTPSPSPSSSASPTPNPTPGGGGVTPSPGQSAPGPGSTPGTGTGPGQKATNQANPGGSNKAPPTRGATPTPTSTPTPTPTSTTTPPPTATLCLSVQPLSGSNNVTVNSTVQFAIFVWLTSGNGGTAKLTLSSSPLDIAPTFSVCATTGGPTCSVSGLKAGQRVEVQAQLIAAKDRLNKTITLNIAGTSKEAINAATASDQIQVQSTSPTPTPTPTPTATHTSNGGGTGNGSTLPPASVPGVGSNSFPGVSSTPGNLGSAFPPVSPSPNVSPKPGSSGQHLPKTVDLSAGLPLDVRLIGGQVIGLAILAAAVTIAVARLSLRRQQPKHSDEGASS